MFAEGWVCMLLHRVLSKLITKGRLTVTNWLGMTRTYGDGTGPDIRLKITSSAVARAIAIDPDLRFGEAYVDGTLQIINGTVYDLIALGSWNSWQPRSSTVPDVMSSVRRLMRRIHQHNPVGKARENVAHHYDLSGKLYDLFLDVDRQYSCAYFETPQANLEEAQLAKKRHIAAKLDIRPGMKVLDIGSGWGGMGLYLAEVCGAQVTGVTLSEEQFKLSNERAAQRGMADRVRFLLKDYRHLHETYDRIVSVGMFEHVGVGHFGEYFNKCKSLLSDDGVMLLHSINRSGGPGATSAWIHKYIFPGGYIPALSEVLPHIESQGLYVSDIEILRLHYAETLRHWRERFDNNRARAAEIYDERFCRMWEFYLAVSECAFRLGGMNNFQIQFSKHQNAMPLTRDYIGQEEKRLKKLEQQAPLLKSVSRREA
jgi:cyclopropane-fatty-acyl-phospholipid synthase